MASRWTCERTRLGPPTLLGPAVSTGDGRFDQGFRVVSGEMGRARTLLSASMRAQLLSVVAAGHSYPRPGTAAAARPGDQASGGTTWGCAGSPR